MNRRQQRQVQGVLTGAGRGICGFARRDDHAQVVGADHRDENPEEQRVTGGGWISCLASSAEADSHPGAARRSSKTTRRYAAMRSVLRTVPRFTSKAARSTTSGSASRGAAGSTSMMAVASAAHADPGNASNSTRAIARSRMDARSARNSSSWIGVDRHWCADYPHWRAAVKRRESNRLAPASNRTESAAFPGGVDSRMDACARRSTRYAIAPDISCEPSCGRGCRLEARTAEASEPQRYSICYHRNDRGGLYESGAVARVQHAGLRMRRRPVSRRRHEPRDRLRRGEGRGVPSAGAPPQSHARLARREPVAIARAS